MLREILDLRYLRGPSHLNDQTANHLSQNRPENHVNKRPRNRGGAVPTVAVGPVSRTIPSVTARDDNAVMCNCGQNALLLTVRKDGPNQGRKFYKCNVGNCNFFLWAEQDGGESRSHGGAVGRGNTNTDTGNIRLAESRGTSGVGETMCTCNQPAVTRTVQKDGPNKGRAFHTCSKPREQQCGFFQWADENALPGKHRNRVTEKYSTKTILTINHRFTNELYEQILRHYRKVFHRQLPTSFSKTVNHIQRNTGYPGYSWVTNTRLVGTPCIKTTFEGARG